MGAQSEASRTQAITGINVTPLVDVTLVLLILFMVTARLITQSQALEVDLPRAATGSETQSVFAVMLRASGELLIDGASVSDDATVLERARAARARNAGLRAVIQADTAAPHGRVMHLLDLLRQAGITRVGFGVVPTHSP